MITAILLLAFIGLALMPLSAQAEEEDNSVKIELIGPRTLGVGVKQQYKVVVSGGPGNTTGGNYTWSAKLGGDLGTEARLTPSMGGPSRTGVFFFNLTAPKSAGKFNVEITAKSFNVSTNVSKTLKVDLKAVDPIVIKAVLKNAGNVTINNVPVFFYLNDDKDSPEEIYNTTVSVPALGQRTVWYNWTSYDLSRGKHEIKVVIDPDSELITVNDEGKESTTTIYYNVSGFGPINAWLWAFVVLLAILVYVIYRRPPKRKKRKKK
ncbi:MAG: hypothetical protein HPY73_04675 [Methanomassiliicoccales archaeon]|nr:MAG: hypothetical protein HPY73_04675 [Methanomassiliicoccales archaeon]